MIPEIRIRIFRATDDPESSLKFIEGHKNILENHGIKKVSSATEAWLSNSSVYVIVMESLDKKKLHGGARIHVADGKTPLPIEEALQPIDPRISNVVKEYAKNKTAEFCGLWKTTEVGTLGVDTFYLIKAALVATEQLGLSSLFFLCSPLTLRLTKWIGCRVLTEIGNQGQFQYPTVNLTATAVVWEDIHTFEKCIDARRWSVEAEKQKILDLRKNPKKTVEEKLFSNQEIIVIHYDLEVRSKPSS